jgi:hypothetical protein
MLANLNPQFQSLRSLLIRRHEIRQLQPSARVVHPVRNLQLTISLLSG